MSESGEMFPNKQEVKIMGKLTKEDFDSEEEISLLSFESDEDGFSIDGAQKPAAASSDTRILNHDVPSPFHFAKDRKCHAETNKHGFSSDEETNSVAHSFDHVHENPVVRPFAAPTGGGPPLAICSFKAASIEMNHQNPIVTHVQNKSISSFSAATMNEFKEIFTDEQEAKIVEKLTSEGFPFGTFDPNLDSQEEIGSWGPEDYEDGFNSDGAENPGAASSSLPASLPAPLLRKTSLPRKKNKKPAKKLLKRSEAPPDEREYIRDSLQPMDVVCGRSGKYQNHPGNLLYRLDAIAQIKAQPRNNNSRARINLVKARGGRFLTMDEHDRWFVRADIAVSQQASILFTDMKNWPREKLDEKESIWRARLSQLNLYAAASRTL